MKITILGSTGFVGKVLIKKAIAADEKTLKSLKISVGDLTDFILQQITSKEWIRKAPLVSI